MRRVLFILILSLVPYIVMAQGTLSPADQLTKWLLESGEMIKAQRYDEAEEFIRKAEDSEVASRFDGYIRFYRSTLCYHKALYKYEHLAYEEAALLVAEGLQYYVGSTDKPIQWVRLTRLLGDCALKINDLGSARQAYALVRDNAMALNLPESYAESLMWIAKIDKEEEKFNEAINGLTQSYNLLYEYRSSKTCYAASALARLYGHDLYNEEKSSLWREREKEAKRLFSKENNLGREVFGKFSFATLADLKITTNRLYKAGKKAEAIAEVTKWITEAEQKQCKDSILLAEVYWWRGSYEYMANRNVDCMKDLKHALMLINHHNNNNRELLYRIWRDVAGCLHHSKLYEKALEANKQAVLNAHKVYGEISIELVKRYEANARFYRGMKNYDGQIRDFCKANTLNRMLVRRNFSFLDKQERASYWRRMGLATKSFPKMIMDYGNTNDHYADSLYLQLLFSKGLLINTDIDERVSVNRDMSFLNITVNDVKHSLPDNCVAIEFCESVDILDTLLCAVILNKRSEHAELVPLCKPSELTSHTYAPDILYDKIWQPLLPYLKNTDAVYFSPVGILNVLPIECSVKLPFKIYRISSTRVLTVHNPLSKREYGVLYGGLQYDMSVGEMQADERKYSNRNVTRHFTENLREAMEDIPYLPGSKTEVEQIEKLFSRYSKKSKVYTAALGTEASFKSLSSKGVDILHIATHGYVIPAQQNNSADAILKRMIKGDEDILREFELMSNSGLLFAGAQNKYDGIDIPEDINDGILTALEISALDLRGLDHVTLSACETAKGDITGDGVFGLQRGFKKAGVNSILMSLWKVDDEATCKLMTEFYSNWIGKKMTKHDALEAAKKTVRETKGWEDPKYWAAFILLDGLD